MQGMGNFGCGTAAAYWANRRLRIDTRHLGLAPEVDEALHRVGSAESFPEAPILWTPEVHWLRAVWTAPNASQALALMLQWGSLPGQLMALAALREVDPRLY